MVFSEKGRPYSRPVNPVIRLREYLLFQGNLDKRFSPMLFLAEIAQIESHYERPFFIGGLFGAHRPLAVRPFLIAVQILDGFA